MTSSSVSAIIDSGTSLIACPSTIATKINNLLGAIDDGYGNYIIDCSTVSTLPNIGFTINGVDYPLTPKDYILQDSSGCYSSFFPMDIPSPAGPLFICTYTSIHFHYYSG